MFAHLWVQLLNQTQDVIRYTNRSLVRKLCPLLDKISRSHNYCSSIGMCGIQASRATASKASIKLNFERRKTVEPCSYSRYTQVSPRNDIQTALSLSPTQWIARPTTQTTRGNVPFKVITKSGSTSLHLGNIVGSLLMIPHT